MQKKLFALATLFGFALANTASAADLPVKAPPLAAPAPVMAPWAGPYIGLALGGKWTSGDMTTNCVQGSSAPPFNCGGTANPFVVDGSSPNDFSGLSGRVGIYLGWNWQIANWVYGVEGDIGFGFSRNTESVSGLVGCSTKACAGGIITPISLAGDSTSVKAGGGDGSIRGRLGYLFVPNMLLYGTGGVAFQEMGEASMSCAFLTSPACTLANHSQTTDSHLRVGWTVGGGVEWMVLPNWLVRGEYRYADFGHSDANFFQGSGDVELLTSIKVRTQIATFGVAYKF
jgi:outer membrane immunogenic protein